MSAPQVQYASNGDVHIAYQVLGEGPLGLVFVAGAITNLDVLWEMSDYRRACERLASFSRLILFDKRGMGLSDRVRVGTLEERMDDMRAILDAVGSKTTVLMGVSEGGPMSILFAGTYPERTSGLVLCGAEVKEETTDDWPWGEATREEFEEAMGSGTGGLALGQGSRGRPLSPPAAKATPSCASSSDASKCSRLHRTTRSPSCAWRSRSTFGTPVVPAVTAPTLIVHRVGDKICSVENARWLARQIEGARYVELPGENHIPFIDGDDILDEIQEFLTGVREPVAPDRMLATVLFTDVVVSTARARESRRPALARAARAAQRGRTSRSLSELSRSGGRHGGRRVLRHLRRSGARSVARARSSRTCAASDSTYARASTPASASRAPARSGDRRPHGARALPPVASPGEVLVSSTVKDLVAGSGIEFTDRGVHELKGIPGEWRLYAAT